MKARDKYVHCFGRTPGMEIYALHTLCGKQYYASSLAMWPHAFMRLIKQVEDGEADYVLCPECVSHEDLPLRLLEEL